MTGDEYAKWLDQGGEAPEELMKEAGFLAKKMTD